MKINAIIPARIGSQRLKRKNLLKINNKFVIEYAIESAIKSKKFNKIFLNSDSEEFEDIAIKHKINFYLRPKNLGSSNTSIDEVIYDFMINYKSDYTFIVNPPSVLQTHKEICKIINDFLSSNFDSLMTVEELFNHFFFNECSLNFNKFEKLKRTQDLKPVLRCVYSLMGWKNSSFIECFEKNGHGLFCGKNFLAKAEKKSCVLLKDEDSFEFIKNMLS